MPRAAQACRILRQLKRDSYLVIPEQCAKLKCQHMAPLADMLLATCNIKRVLVRDHITENAMRRRQQLGCAVSPYFKIHALSEYSHTSPVSMQPPNHV